ncbi:MAG: hypothetical protein ABFD79_01270 [Phycisphaerales bacterium]
MKKLFLIIAVFGTCFAIESPVEQSINSRGPVTSYESGLRRSPNPVNLNGNDVITGNVSGGKEFRGFVPYRSESDIGAPVATDSFNSFLRRTAPVNYGVREPYLPQPYYVPSRTVTSMRRGNTSGLITYAPIRTTGGTGDFPAPSYARPLEIAGLKDSSHSYNIPEYQYTLSRPLSYTNPTDLEKIVNYGLASQQEKEELQEALNRINAEEQKLKEKETKIEKAEEVEPEDTTETITEPLAPAERSEPTERAKPGQVPTDKYLESKKSLYEQILEQVEIARKTKTKETKETKEANEPKEETDNESRKSQLSEIEKETAEALKDVHKTFATKAKTRFNHYMKTAEEFLHEGEYYRAADAYTLASIYNPSDPLAYAGRSHALFASGEYMSSSYYLMRAIKMFPEYAQVRVDLHAMIPDKDRLQSRIDDINKWIDKTQSPELEFLLAYLYKQLDNDKAVDLINSAASKLPDNQAVVTLKNVIENK